MNRQTEVARADTILARHGWPASATFHYENGSLLFAEMDTGTRWVYHGLDGWDLPLWVLDDGEWLDVRPVRDGEGGEFIVVPKPVRRRG